MYECKEYKIVSIKKRRFFSYYTKCPTHLKPCELYCEECNIAICVPSMYHNVFLNFELFLKKERIHAKNLQELKINILTKICT